MKVDTKALLGLSTEHLIELSSGQQINKTVQAPFANLQQAAKDAGFDLQIASCYRNFDRQKAIWNAKFCGIRPIFDHDGNQVDIDTLSQWQTCQAILLYSALPGSSRHHWGTDIDFYDAKALPKDYQLQLIASEYDHHGPCAPLTQWLRLNAQQYGFYFPYRHYLGGIACEPWHISHHQSAHQFQDELTTDKLRTILETSDIEGKGAILINLEEIYNRYIINISDINTL